MHNVLVGPIGESAVVNEIRCEKCKRLSPADPLPRIVELIVDFHLDTDSLPPGKRSAPLKETLNWFMKVDPNTDPPRGRLSELRDGLRELAPAKLGRVGRKLLSALDRYLGKA
jgi:hypothetical protein